MSNFEKKITYVCPGCRGENIQEQAWVEVNTGDVVDMTGLEFYCPDCEAFFKCPEQKDAEDGKSRSV